MLVVTGASGRLGRGIVEQLLARADPAGIGVSVRDPGKVADFAQAGVRVRAGDFADPASLRHSFEGAEQILLVSSNAAAHGGDPLAQHRNAIDAARAVGARRIVYTSHMAANGASAFPPMHSHAATEAMLAASGLAWTALRNGFYAASGIQFMGDAPRSGVLAALEDGPVAWTAHADLAEAAAIVLTGEDGLDGPTPPLTAGEALDMTGLAHLATEVVGRPIRREPLSEEDLRARMNARGMPPQAAEIALGFYRAAHAGEFAAVNPTLERLLGRAPTTMRQVMAEEMR